MVLLTWFLLRPPDKPKFSRAWSLGTRRVELVDISWVMCQSYSREKVEMDPNPKPHNSVSNTPSVHAPQRSITPMPWQLTLQQVMISTEQSNRKLGVWGWYIPLG